MTDERHEDAEFPETDDVTRRWSGGEIPPPAPPTRPGLAGPEAARQQYPSQPPAAQQPPAQQPAAQQPPAQQPAAQQPPAQQQPGQQYPGQQSAAQQPAAQQPAAQQYPGQQYPGQQSAAQQQPGQPPAAQQPPAQQPGQGQWGQQSQPGQQYPGQQPPAQYPGQQPPAQQPGEGQWGQQPPAQQPGQGQWGQQPPAQQPGQGQWGQQPPAQQPGQGQWGQQSGQGQWGQQEGQYWSQPGQPQQPAQQWGQGPATHQPDQFGGLPASTTQGSVQRGFPLGRLGLIAAVLVVAGIGGFALWRALATPGGAASPEEAAAQAFAAAENEDLLGVVEIMLPSERESLVQPFTDMMIELARLDLAAEETVENGELSNFTGLTIDFPDEGEPGALVYEVEPFGTSETVHWVTVTDGMVTTTFDENEIRNALGARLDEALEEELAETDPEFVTETVDLGELYDEGDPLEFAVVEEDGSWYVSLWYSVAGLANEGQAPNFNRALDPVGAESAEAAAAEFVESLIELDMEPAMALLDPEEFRALYDFWDEFGPELVDGARDARDNARLEGFDWSVESISVSSMERNGRRIAVIDELSMNFSFEDDFDQADITVGLSAAGLMADGFINGEPFEISISGDLAKGQGTLEGETFEFEFNTLTYEGYGSFGPDQVQTSRDGDCLVVTFNGESERLCDEDLGTDPAVFSDLQEDYAAVLEDLDGNPGLTVVERNGRWYVSGFPTFAYGAVDVLRAIEPEEIDDLIESYEELIEQIEDGTF